MFEGTVFDDLQHNSMNLPTRELRLFAVRNWLRSGHKTQMPRPLGSEERIDPRRSCPLIAGTDRSQSPDPLNARGSATRNFKTAAKAGPAAMHFLDCVKFLTLNFVVKNFGAF